MSVSVGWDNPEKTISRMDFSDHWTLDELFEAKARGDAMIDAANHARPVGVMLVMSRRVHLPPNIISATRVGIVSRHPRAKMIVLVADSGFVKSLFSVIIRVYPEIAHVYRRVDTLEQGRAFLKDFLAGLEAESAPAAAAAV